MNGPPLPVAKSRHGRRGWPHWPRRWQLAALPTGQSRLILKASAPLTTSWSSTTWLTGSPNLYFRESYWDYTTTYFDGSADVEQTGAVGSGCQLYFHDITAEFELGAPYPTNLSFDFASPGRHAQHLDRGSVGPCSTTSNLLHDTWWGTPPYTWIHATVTWYSGNTGRVTLTSTVSNGISFFRIGGQELIIDNVSEAPPPPENDNCDEAQPVEDGVYEFDSRGATTDGPEESECDWWGYAHIESEYLVSL